MIHIVCPPHPPFDTVSKVLGTRGGVDISGTPLFSVGSVTQWFNQVDFIRMLKAFVHEQGGTIRVGCAFAGCDIARKVLTSISEAWAHLFDVEVVNLQVTGFRPLIGRKVGSFGSQLVTRALLREGPDEPLFRPWRNRRPASRKLISLR